MMLVGATPWRRLSRSAALRQLRRYMLVGATNNLVAFGALNLCLLLFASRTQASLVLYSSVAYVLSTINSYVWNRRWTFGRGRRQRRIIWRFGLLNLLTFGLNALCVWALTALLPLIFTLSLALLANLASWISSLICGLANFLGSRIWVFQAVHRAEPLPLQHERRRHPGQPRMYNERRREFQRHGASRSQPASR